MAVVQVRIVPVAMPQRRVYMRMRMGFAAVPGEVVLMLVVRVMYVRVRMCQRPMTVFMLVALD